jgi:hypothetical protein
LLIILLTPLQLNFLSPQLLASLAQCKLRLNTLLNHEVLTTMQKGGRQKFEKVVASIRQ